MAWALWASLRFLSPLIKPDVGASLATGFTSKHGGGPRWTRRRRITPSSPNATVSGKRLVPRDDTLWPVPPSLDAELPPMARIFSRVVRVIASHPSLPSSKACRKSGPCPPALPGLIAHMALDFQGDRHKVTSRARQSSPPGLPRLPVSLFQRAVPTTPRTRTGAVGCFPLPRGLPITGGSASGFTFEACSGFTRITARWIAQPPKAAFTGLDPSGYPDKPPASYQIKPTTVWVVPSSTRIRVDAL